nr:hypothetical protein [Oceanococcus sp. HetDA_MAG_MS8]
MRNKILSIALASLLLTVAGCASSPEEQGTDQACADCGRVVAVEPTQGTRIQPRELPGEAVSGQILSPTAGLNRMPQLQTQGTRSLLLDNQVPVVEVPDMGRLSRRAEITLNMDQGGMRTLIVDDPGTVQVGDRVRIVGSRLWPAPAASQP